MYDLGNYLRASFEILIYRSLCREVFMSLISLSSIT
jgi:hypothetical protein